MVVHRQHILPHYDCLVQDVRHLTQQAHLRATRIPNSVLGYIGRQWLLGGGQHLRLDSTMLSRLRDVGGSCANRMLRSKRPLDLPDILGCFERCFHIGNGCAHGVETQLEDPREGNAHGRLLFGGSVGCNVFQFAIEALLTVT